MRSHCFIACSLLWLAAIGRAEDLRRLEDPAERASYSLGHQIGLAALGAQVRGIGG